MSKHPYDNWPSATYEGEWLPENGDEPPRPEEEAADIHQKMYEIATSKYNPFAVGGSESIHDFEGGKDEVS
jgi:hypothetical protein|tara:strand:- start:15 stop:227 length:213 start_codon:yes stop_codon:yes gene_type:complete